MARAQGPIPGDGDGGRGLVMYCYAMHAYWCSFEDRGSKVPSALSDPLLPHSESHQSNRISTVVMYRRA